MRRKYDADETVMVELTVVEAEAERASEAHCERNGAIVKLPVVCDEEVEYDA